MIEDGAGRKTSGTKSSGSERCKMDLKRLGSFHLHTTNQPKQGAIRGAEPTPGLGVWSLTWERYQSPS